MTALGGELVAGQCGEVLDALERAVRAAGEQSQVRRGTRVRGDQDRDAADADRAVALIEQFIERSA